MAGKKPSTEGMPTPGPWLVRGKASTGASPEAALFGVEPATGDQAGGWPYLIRQHQPFAPGDCPLHIATGIQRLADARLMAAAPDLADSLFQLLTSPALPHRGLDRQTQALVADAWGLLVRVAPHLEI